MIADGKKEYSWDKRRKETDLAKFTVENVSGGEVGRMPGDKKSTSGGMMRYGPHQIKTWITTQGIIALSSGEAEFYKIVKAGSQLLGMSAMMNDFGVAGKMKIFTDASAAQGICGRKGLGPVRHIEVHQLWIQGKVRDGDFIVEKVDGESNLGDCMTKYNDSADLDRHCEMSRIERSTGRHKLTPDMGEGEYEVMHNDETHPRTPV